MRFTKMQGTGNDFILVEAAGLERDWRKLAETMCDRHFGVGADGLILVLPSTRADIRMRIFNADGSEAEMCGNGIRCLAKYIVHRGMAKPETKNLAVETLAGIRKIKMQHEGKTLRGSQVSMGAPKFRPEEIPVTLPPDKAKAPILDYPLVVDGRRLSLSFVSMGNPHAVFFIKEGVADFPLRELGPKVEKHKMFPNRINFEVARVVNRRLIEARVWERGAGETLACGTGACAIAVAAQLHGYVDKQVDIMLPGGTLHMEWDGAGEVLLSGPAGIVFSGEWPEDCARNENEVREKG